MYVYGSDCTLTVERGGEFTAVPYTLETLREEPACLRLDPLAGSLRAEAYLRGDLAVLGCFVTRVCGFSRDPLAALLRTGNAVPFNLYLNRVVEKRVYRNLVLTGWEVRAERDGAVYARLDVRGNEAADWDFDTPDIPWIQNETLEFSDGDIALAGVPSANIYRFALTRTFGDAVETILQLHYPLKTCDAVNDRREFSVISVTLGNRLRCTLGSAALLSFQANTDNAEEILVVRRFRIDGDCRIETRNEAGEWVEEP